MEMSVVDWQFVTGKVLAKEEELNEHYVLGFGDHDFVIVLEIIFIGWAVDVQDQDHWLSGSAQLESGFELEFQQQAAGSLKDRHGRA